MAEKTIWGPVGAAKVTMTWEENLFRLPSDVNNLYPESAAPLNARAFYYNTKPEDSIAFTLNAIYSYFKDTPFEELLSGNVQISVEPYHSPTHATSMQLDDKRAKYHLGMIKDFPYLVCEDYRFMAVPLGKGNHFSDEMMTFSLFERSFASASVDGLQDRVLIPEILAYGKSISSIDVTNLFQSSISTMVEHGWYHKDGQYLSKDPKTRYSWEAE